MKNNSDFKSIVMDYPRRDTRDKITGFTKYTIDHSKSNCLFAVLFRSTVASAKIKKLDYQKALNYPGVKAIISSKDIPFLHGIGVEDQPMFATDYIRYYGEPILAIAAETKETAFEAINFITMEIQELDPVLNLSLIHI